MSVRRIPRVVVVDDDPGQRAILDGFLSARGCSVRSAPDAETALRLLGEAPADVCLMDVRMPGMGGLEGLARIRETSNAPAVILLTAHADLRDAVEAMRRGAVDYLEKPVDLEELATVVAETIGESGAEEAAEHPSLPPGFIASSAAMRKVVAEAALVAPTAATVLLTGESGTGKERIAELIHSWSPRRAGPLVRLNCAAVPPSLFESELFGHRKGAFTGADQDRVGRFEAASGGTILLDEIGELPLAVQPKLLRVLEDGSFERVGESQGRRSDARVVAATNRDLESEAREGRFREDLFWRLNVFRIHLPALRERPEEILELARAFLARRSREGARISPAALRALESYRWPGNARELGNVVERASILATGNVILPEHLPESVRAPASGARSSSLLPPSGEAIQASAPSGPAAEAGPGTVEEAERRAIREALRETGGNRTRAARILGISRRTLLYRLKRYGGEP